MRCQPRNQPLAHFGRQRFAVAELVAGVHVKQLDNRHLMRRILKVSEEDGHPKVPNSKHQISNNFQWSEF
jgi:hypothetical protein